MNRHVFTQAIRLTSKINLRFTTPNMGTKFDRNNRWFSTKLLAQNQPVLQKYRELLEPNNEKDGVSKPTEKDIHQLKTIAEFDRLFADFQDLSSFPQSSISQKSSSTLFGSLFGDEEQETMAQTNHVRGIYVHGGVGCGKTFCMNLFYSCIVESEEISHTIQKVHFHQFMLDVHRRMHTIRQQGQKGDSLPMIADEIILEGIILCFDEFQVTDVADALILRRLFTSLFERGGVIVATSNRTPADLYKNGLQRDLFVPFIDLLEQKTKVVSMTSSKVDYRIVHGLHKAKGTYFLGDPFIRNKSANKNEDKGKLEFNSVFDQLTLNAKIGSTFLSTQGRNVLVPQCVLEKSIARFSFYDLCGAALGAADYLAIADRFSTIFLEDIPQLKIQDMNVVRRFITLVDALYENNVILIIHAEKKIDKLFVVDDDAGVFDEVFAFDRTRSRLDEMGSIAYLKSRK